MNLSYSIMSLLNHVFGKGMKRFYEVYYFSCNPKNYIRIGKHVTLERPLFVTPSTIELGSYIRIQPNVKIITSPRQRVIIKDFTAIGAGTTIIAGNHTPTVSVPQYLSYLGINDANSILTIEEDAWIGANSTILYKATIGRGAIVAANSVVTKNVPPYAIVSGVPAKITGVRFSPEQILEHEMHLYIPEKRLDQTFINELFERHYSSCKVLGKSLQSFQSETLDREKNNIELEDFYNYK